jgi:hypothetical protein
VFFNYNRRRNLGFVYSLNYKIKLQRFGSWILLPSSDEKRERGPDIRLAQPGGPTDRVSVLFPLF